MFVDMINKKVSNIVGVSVCLPSFFSLANFYPNLLYMPLFKSESKYMQVVRRSEVHFSIFHLEGLLMAYSFIDLSIKIKAGSIIHINSSSIYLTDKSMVPLRIFLVYKFS